MEFKTVAKLEEVCFSPYWSIFAFVLDQIPFICYGWDVLLWFLIDHKLVIFMDVSFVTK